MLNKRGLKRQNLNFRVMQKLHKGVGYFAEQNFTKGGYYDTPLCGHLVIWSRLSKSQ